MHYCIAWGWRLECSCRVISTMFRRKDLNYLQLVWLNAVNEYCLPCIPCNRIDIHHYLCSSSMKENIPRHSLEIVTFIFKGHDASSNENPWFLSGSVFSWVYFFCLINHIRNTISSRMKILEFFFPDRIHWKMNIIFRVKTCISKHLINYVHF